VTDDLEHEQTIMRTVVGRVAAARGLPAPWSDQAELPVWLAAADMSGWGVVELGEARQRLVPKRRRDRDGVVYTPVEVVGFMVRSAMQASGMERFAGRADALGHITVVDPSCGCGIFPVHVAHYVARWYAAQLAGEDPPGWLVAAVLPEVLTECVYGIDLDPVAVDVARAACWLEIGGTRPITFMDDNLVIADTFTGDLASVARKLDARWPGGIGAAA
jgi:hypothetical protein